MSLIRVAYTKPYADNFDSVFRKNREQQAPAQKLAHCVHCFQPIMVPDTEYGHLGAKCDKCPVIIKNPGQAR